MKKIAIVTRDMFGGGAERVIAQLIKYFDSINIKCLLITIDEKKIFYEIPYRVKMISIGKKSSNKIVDRILRYKEVRRIIKSNDIDVVLTMPEEIGIYLIPALFFTKIPVVVSERNNPWVMPDKIVTRILRRFVYLFVDGIIFQTEKAKSFFPKFIQKKGIILFNPVDLSRIPKQYNGDRKKIIVAAGRLESQKNFPLLIKSFYSFQRTYKDFKLIIYGEGKMEQELKKMISDMKIEDKVILPGRKKNLLEIMNSASMFVLSSNYEGMPNVLIEAMCMGMPVIATDCQSGGPSELIENGINGLLVPVNDSFALTEAMCKLIDSDISEVLGKNAYNLREKLESEKIFMAWKDYIFSRR